MTVWWSSVKPTLPVIVGGGVPTVQGDHIIAVGGTTTFERVGQGNGYGAKVIPWDWEDFVLGSRLRGIGMVQHDHDHEIFLYLLRGADMIGRVLQLRGYDIFVFYSCMLWCDVQKYPYFQSN